MHLIYTYLVYIWFCASANITRKMCVISKSPLRFGYLEAKLMSEI